MAQPPSPPGPPPPQPPYPYPYPYYAPPPARSDGNVVLLVVLIVVVVVAILAICSAIMYVLVSSLIRGPGPGPQVMGIVHSRSSDGVDWILIVTSTPGGKAYASTTLTIFRSDGSTNLTATPFANLDRAGEGCALQRAVPGSTTVTVGDRILCRTSWYASNSAYRISEGANILASGTLFP